MQTPFSVLFFVIDLHSEELLLEIFYRALAGDCYVSHRFKLFVQISNNLISLASAYSHYFRNFGSGDELRFHWTSLTDILKYFRDALS